MLPRPVAAVAVLENADAAPDTEVSAPAIFQGF